MKTTQPIKVPKKKEHYVSTKEFLVAMKEYKAKCIEAEKRKKATTYK